MIKLMRKLSHCESVSFGVNLSFKLNLVNVKELPMITACYFSRSVQILIQLNASLNK